MRVSNKVVYSEQVNCLRADQVCYVVPRFGQNTVVIYCHTLSTGVKKGADELEAEGNWEPVVD